MLSIVKQLENKYKFAVSDDTIEYKYIPETITEISKDLKIVEKIIGESNDEEVLRISQSLKSKLTESCKFLTKKLENIPNKYYLVESDEDWIDENHPN